VTIEAKSCLGVTEAWCSADQEHFQPGCTRFIKNAGSKKSDSKIKFKSLQKQRPPLNACAYSEELHPSLRRCAECACRVKADNEHLEQ